jgi:mRNA interferase MazF
VTDLGCVPWSHASNAVDIFGAGLPKDSVVNPTQLLTLDEDDLGPAVGRVPGTLSLDLDAGLRRVLHL